VSAAGYVEHVYLLHLLSSEFDRVAGNEWISADLMKDSFHDAMSIALAAHGYNIEGRYRELIDAHFAAMAAQSIIQLEGDDFTGTYAMFSVDAKDGYLNQHFKNSEISRRLKRLPDEALAQALTKAAEIDGWLPVNETGQRNAEAAEVSDSAIDQFPEIPASDRTVTISHNAVGELVSLSDELIEQVSEGADAEDATGRSKALGQLKAGRELLREATFSVFLMHQTVLTLLARLIEKYKGHAIGATAKKLLEMLIEHVFKGQ
jgi:hypothetical protein